MNAYEWMLLNGDRLAAAIKEDGKVNGPASSELLEELMHCQRPRQTFNQARKLLIRKLAALGMAGVVPE